jgi:cation diffusion facilitator family transporter
MDDAGRLRQLKRVLYLVLATNVGLAGLKLGWGYTTSTLGLIADGYHSLLDSAASVIGLVGATLAAEPPDREHQYGHRKFEILSAMAISMFIFLGAFEVLREASTRVFEKHDKPDITWVSFGIAALSIVLGFLLSRFEARKARELKSAVLDSDSAHTWSDVASSLAVLVGLAAALFVHPLADSIIALALGLYLIRVGYKILMRGLGIISDRAVLDPEEVKRVARDLQGVMGTANIRTRGEETHTFLDMILLVDPKLTVAEAHDLVDRFEARLSQEFPGLRDIVIHVEPAGYRPSDEGRVAS